MSRVGDSTHGIEASQDHDDKEKREERREKSEERREKKEEKRDPKRGRQRSPNEAARGGPTLFSAIPPPGGTSGGFEGRGRRAEECAKRLNNEQLNCNCTATGFALSQQREEERERRAETREKRS